MCTLCSRLKTLKQEFRKFNQKESDNIQKIELKRKLHELQISILTGSIDSTILAKKAKRVDLSVRLCSGTGTQ